MVSFRQGNLLDARVEAVVNTVNTVGVMGKGIALMFKDRFPENFSAYVRACESGNIRLGKMFVTQDANLLGRQWVINFPTKQHWRGKTRMEWIEDGLHDLVRIIEEKDIQSIAIPPLGCGNGGLDWKDVRPIVRALRDLRTGGGQNVGNRRGGDYAACADAGVVGYAFLVSAPSLVQKLAVYRAGIKRSCRLKILSEAQLIGTVLTLIIGKSFSTVWRGAIQTHRPMAIGQPDKIASCAVDRWPHV